MESPGRSFAWSRTRSTMSRAGRPSCASSRSRPERDVRAKRPPVLSFLLRWDTLRRAPGSSSLLALDFVGVSLAIFTALALEGSRQGPVHPDQFDTTRHRLVRLPRDGAAVRALAHVREPRRAPRASRVLARSSEVTIVT